jgi:hypothetical protein
MEKGIDPKDPEIIKYEKLIQEHTEGHQDIVKLKGDLEAKRNALRESAFNENAKTKEIHKKISDRKSQLTNSGISEDHDAELTKLKSEFDEHKKNFKSDDIDNHPDVKEIAERIQRKRDELESRQNSDEDLGEKKMSRKKYWGKKARQAYWAGKMAAKASLMAGQGASVGIGGAVGAINASSSTAAATSGAGVNGINMAGGAIHSGIQSGIGTLTGGGSMAGLGDLTSMRPSLFSEGGGMGGSSSYDKGRGYYNNGNSDNDLSDSNSDNGGKTRGGDNTNDSYDDDDDSYDSSDSRQTYNNSDDDDNSSSSSSSSVVARRR